MLCVCAFLLPSIVLCASRAVIPHYLLDIIQISHKTYDRLRDVNWVILLTQLWFLTVTKVLLKIEEVSKKICD